MTEYTFPVANSQHNGLSKREYFASQALIGLLSTDEGVRLGSRVTVEAAYLIADLMVESGDQNA